MVHLYQNIIKTQRKTMASTFSLPQDLTLELLKYLSGGETNKMLEYCLSDKDKKDIVSAGSGKKRFVR